MESEFPHAPLKSRIYNVEEMKRKWKKDGRLRAEDAAERGRNKPKSKC